MDGPEKEFLQYTGNKVPWPLIAVWVTLILFSLVYLAQYMWPDLVTWTR